MQKIKFLVQCGSSRGELTSIIAEAGHKVWVEKWEKLQVSQGQVVTKIKILCVLRQKMYNGENI